MAYDVFISYSSDDVKFSRLLEAELSKMSLEVFRDQSRLLPGRPYASALLRAVGSAKTTVVLWTQQASRSDWVTSEIRRALEVDTLLPVIIDDAAPSNEISSLHQVRINSAEITPVAPAFKHLVRRIFERVRPQKTPVQSPAVELPGRLLEDYPDEIRRAQDLAEMGDCGDAYFELAEKWHIGAGYPVDQVAAAQLYKRAHASGHPMAAFNLASMYRKAQNEAHYEHWIEQAAKRGVADAQFRIAADYFATQPYGERISAETAIHWAERSALEGSARGRYVLASMLEDGFGCAPDMERAIENYLLAGSQLHPLAICRLVELSYSNKDYALVSRLAKTLALQAASAQGKNRHVYDEVLKRFNALEP